MGPVGGLQVGGAKQGLEPLDLRDQQGHGPRQDARLAWVAKQTRVDAGGLRRRDGNRDRLEGPGRGSGRRDDCGVFRLVGRPQEGASAGVASCEEQGSGKDESGGGGRHRLFNNARGGKVLGRRCISGKRFHGFACLGRHDASMETRASNLVTLRLQVARPSSNLVTLCSQVARLSSNLVTLSFAASEAFVEPGDA